MLRIAKKRYRFINAWAVLIIFLSFNSASQVFYSTRADYLKSKTEQNNILSAYRSSYPDTTVTMFSEFSPRNFLGNLGLPSPSFLFTYGTDDIGFRFFQPPVINDRFSEKQVAYYRTVGPFASLTGIAGSKQLQIFRMLFTHTYKDKLNISIRFNRYTSKGFYRRQQTYTNNFYLSSNYTTRNKRSGFYLFLLNNSNKNNENGGISNETLTDSTMLINKELLSVRISNANRDNRELKAMINPWIRLNKRSDSTHLNDHYLQLKSRFVSNSYTYRDPGIAIDNYYQAAYFDTVTKDSSNLRQFINELSYSTFLNKKSIGISVGYRNEITTLWQRGNLDFMNNILVSDLVYRSPVSPIDTGKTKPYLENRFNFQYNLDGENAGNYKAENNLSLVLNTKRNYGVFFNSLFENRNPDYIYNYWQSNHFVWKNNGFKEQQQLQLNAGFYFSRIFQVSVLYNAIQNFLYFDELALPVQSKKQVDLAACNAKITKIFFRHLGIVLDYTRQLTNDDYRVRVPLNIATGRLFYHGNLFRNNLQLQVGAQLQVYDSFYSYSYMPSTQIFYLQNKFQATPYPYTDLFLQGRIRPVSFFLKAENILQGLAGPGYSLVNGYYQPDLAFRFGINWMFFD
jgi:hypothetical protein